MHIQDSHWSTASAIAPGGGAMGGAMGSTMSAAGNGRDASRSAPLRVDAQRNLEHVLRAAREVFGELGYGAPMEDVARRARVGVGTVYRRFPTKDALFEAIFQDGIDQLAAFAETALDAEDSWEGFASFVWQMCELTATDRGLREVAFSKAYCGRGVDAGRNSLDPWVSKLVARAKRDGYLRPEVSSTDMPLLGLMTGAVSEYAGDMSVDLWRRYVAVLLQGMRCQPGLERLPVDALSQDELQAAMIQWPPTESAQSP